MGMKEMIVVKKKLIKGTLFGNYIFPLLNCINLLTLQVSTTVNYREKPGQPNLYHHFVLSMVVCT